MGLARHSTVRTWREFNDLYFAGELQPVPIVLTYMQPFGRRIAFCSYSPTVPLGVAGILQRERNANFGRMITLNVPQAGKFLVADNATLLHEMIHQYLSERGESASHDSEPWRRNHAAPPGADQRGDLGRSVKDHTAGRKGCADQRATAGDCHQ